jgi:hypothetical protein
MSGIDRSGIDPFRSDAILRVLHLSPEQLIADDYADAYRQISDGWPEPLETIHPDDSVLTRHQAVLFIPARAAPGLYGPGFAPNFRLYQNQTLVDESAGDMLPRWLRWVPSSRDPADPGVSGKPPSPDPPLADVPGDQRPWTDAEA